MSVTGCSLFFLVPQYRKPSEFLVSLVFILFFLQPIEFFSVITLGLYSTDRQRSKGFLRSPALVHLLLVGLTTGEFLIVFFEMFSAKPLALSPLMLLVGLSFYLNWAK